MRLRDRKVLAREHEPYRPPGLEHEVADDVLDEHLLLGSEPAPDAGLDDAYVFHGETQERSNHPPGMERDLRGGPQHESFVLVEPAHGDMGLDRALLHLVDPEELDPPDGALLAVDSERESVRRSLDRTTRVEYRRAFTAWLEDTATSVRAARVRYFRAETTEPAAHLVRRVAGENRVQAR